MWFLSSHFCSEHQPILNFGKRCIRSRNISYFFPLSLRFEYFNTIKKEVSKIQEIIQEQLKEMLIPNYKIKKLLRINKNLTTKLHLKLW
jgi:hypothetical protein